MALPKEDQLAALLGDLREAFADAEAARDKLDGGTRMLALMDEEAKVTRDRLVEARAKLDAFLGVHVEVALIEERTLCEAEPRYTRGMTTVTPACDGLACERPGCPTHDQQYGEVEVQ